MKGTKMFNLFQNCLKGQKLDYNDQKKINSFIFKRYISGCLDGLMYSSYVNSYDLKEDVLYEYYRTVLKKKVKYIKWIKEDKELEDILFLKKHYKVNNQVAKDYYDLLTKEQIKSLKDLYGGRK